MVQAEAGKNKEKLIGEWCGGILTAVGLIFLIFILANLYQNRARRPPKSKKCKIVGAVVSFLVLAIGIGLLVYFLCFHKKVSFNFTCFMLINIRSSS